VLQCVLQCDSRGHAAAYDLGGCERVLQCVAVCVAMCCSAFHVYVCMHDAIAHDPGMPHTAINESCHTLQ